MYLIENKKKDGDIVEHQFDEITAKFIEIHEGARPVVRLVVFPTIVDVVKHAVEGMSNIEVFDGGCGGGKLGRELIKLDAISRIAGVDISPVMIARARQGNPNISYFVSDLADPRMAFQGEFDIAIASLVLNHQSTEEKLLTVCRNFHRHLVPGGKFVILGNNPNHALIDNNQYGTTIEAREASPLKDGSPLTVTLYQNCMKQCSFTIYHWTSDTVRRILKEAGFKITSWLPAWVSEEGKRDYEDFTWFYEQARSYMVMECIRMN